MSTQAEVNLWIQQANQARTKAYQLQDKMKNQASMLSATNGDSVTEQQCWDTFNTLCVKIRAHYQNTGLRKMNAEDNSVYLKPGAHWQR